MTIVGFHDVVVATSPPAEKAVMGPERLCANGDVSWPGVRVATPLEGVVAGPDQ